MSEMQPIQRFRLMVAAALADGVLHEDERRFLEAAASRMGIPVKDVTEVLRDLGNVSIPSLEDSDEREAVFRSVVDVTLADRHLDPKEKAFLHRLAHSLGIEPSEVGALIGEGLRAAGLASPPAATVERHGPPALIAIAMLVIAAIAAAAIAYVLGVFP